MLIYLGLGSIRNHKREFMFRIQPSALLSQIRHATHKSGGSTSNGRTSQPKYLGFKKMHGAKVEAGSIILRQRGTQWHIPPKSPLVGLGRDHTIYAKKSGTVHIYYSLDKQRRYVTIDDGTLDVESHTTKPQMKKRLVEMIDVPKYLACDSKGRYDMVMRHIEELTVIVRGEAESRVKERSKLKGLRNFGLIDITQL